MRSRRAVVGGLVAVAAVIVLVVGAVLLSGSDATSPIGAVAAVQDDHLPIDPIETIPARLDLIDETGVTTTRVDLFWSDIARSRPASPADPADPAYDFARADLIMQGLAERGITPIVSVYSTPAWAAGGRQDAILNQVNTLAPDPADFGDFMRALATRYAGDFAGPSGATLPRVAHYEIWNEPNLTGFLDPEVEGTVAERAAARLDLYAEMARAGHAAIKAADPEAVVIVGVGGPRSSTSLTGVSALEWLDGLRERDVPLDAYSQHVYPAAPPTLETDVVPSWSSMGRVLEALDAWRPDIPLYITEAGYTTAATPFRRSFVSEDEQAQYLDEIYSLPQLRTDQIRAVVWFNLEDNSNWPAGLLRAGDLTEKPSYDRFLEVVREQEGARLR